MEKYQIDFTKNIVYKLVNGITKCFNVFRDQKGIHIYDNGCVYLTPQNCKVL